MKTLRLLMTAAALLLALSAPAQPGQRQPNIGYAFPAGAQQGQTVRVIVGGQRLGGLKDAHLSGEGIEAKVIKHYRSLGNINGDQRKEMRRQWSLAARQRWDELVAQGTAPKRPPYWLPRKVSEEPADPAVKMPEHPLLEGLAEMSLAELLHVRAVMFDQRKSQPNVQIAESVLVELTVAADAEPGDRELRLLGRSGITNPIVFQVGTLPETRELEDNDPDAVSPLPIADPLQLPVLVNGQILPGDVDRFRFDATKGQRLVLRLTARRLVPYLADAVPGWFQATLTVYDADGREVAFADDHRFDPDPVMTLIVPSSGTYTVDVRDAIYRGREDFVYRLAIGELPQITNVFPLGGPAGREAVANVSGINLTSNRLLLAGADATPGAGQVTMRCGVNVTNPVAFALSDLPERLEKEPNSVPAMAQPMSLPVLVNGRITEPGDVDVFSFVGMAGDEVVVEVTARRLGSPLDALVRLLGPAGEIVAWNDDHVRKDGVLFINGGEQTHQADSYLRATLPDDGTYCVAITDARAVGSEAASYRLRISAPRPDVTAIVTPSSLAIGAGQSAPLTVHLLRHDGFDGPVRLAVHDPAAGFTLQGATVPAGADRAAMTLTAPTTRQDAPLELRLDAVAEIDGTTVVRVAQPADEQMQAFLYRHLVPRERLLVTVGGWARGNVRFEPEEGALHLTPGCNGQLRVRVHAPRGADHPVTIQVVEAPAGVTLTDVQRDGQDLLLTLSAADDAAPTAGNLICAASTQVPQKDKDGKAGRGRTVDLGVLPAIPCRIAP